MKRPKQATISFSVNEAIEMLDGLEGKVVRIRGLLSFEFENVSLSHVLLAERAHGYASSVWLTVGSDALSFDEKTWQRLHGKVVVVEGTLCKPDPRFGGCGHMSLWPAEIVSRTVELAPNDA